MENAAKTIAKLRRLAAGQGNEAETAGEVLREMEAKNPGAASEADSASEEIVSLDCPTDGSWHQEQLFVAVCDYLGIDGLRYKDKRAKAKIARGPRSLVQAVPKLFESMKAKLAELHKGTTTGFIIGALPREKTYTDDETEPLSPDAMKAARAAHGIGINSNPRSLLPSKAGVGK